MAIVDKPLEDARDIFTDLGYEVTDAGDELRAQRKWRTVYVTDAAPDGVDESVEFRCFVARAGRAHTLRQRLLSTAPNYDWAVLRIDEDGDYEVLHPSAGQVLSPNDDPDPRPTATDDS